MAFMGSRMVQINPQVYALLQSHISDHISYKARKEVTEQLSQDPILMDLKINDPQAYQIAFDNAVATAVAEITQSLVQGEMQSNMNKMDPLVRIKQQEVDLKAADLQRKIGESEFRQGMENARQQEKLGFEREKLQQQDEASDKRLEIAEQKLEIARNK